MAQTQDLRVGDVLSFVDSFTSNRNLDVRIGGIEIGFDQVPARDNLDEQVQVAQVDLSGVRNRAGPKFTT